MFSINVSLQHSAGTKQANDQRSISVQDDTNDKDMAAAFQEALEFLEEAKPKYLRKK